MRSSGGTKSGEPSVVTFWTKLMIPCLAFPSFQDGSGSAAWQITVVNANAQTSAAARIRFPPVVFMDASLFVFVEFDGAHPNKTAGGPFGPPAAKATPVS